MRCPTETADILLDIIRMGILAARAAGWANDAAAAAFHADHVHNLPNLLADFSAERLLYYWDVERPVFMHQALPAEVEAFQPLWNQLADVVPKLSPTAATG
jgi:hypothetical protein